MVQITAVRMCDTAIREEKHFEQTQLLKVFGAGKKRSRKWMRYAVGFGKRSR